MHFGKYRVIACTVKYWREDKTKPPRFNKKTKQWEHPKVPMYHRHIWMEVVENKDGDPINDGMVWRFTSTKRGRWSDSRDKSEEHAARKVSLGDKEIKAELARLCGFHASGRIWQTMEETEVNKEEYADLIGVTLVPYEEEDDDGEMVERTRMEGGLPARIEAQTAKSKATAALSKTVNRR